MEKVAICYLNGRIAPRYDYTNEFLIVTIRDGKEIVVAQPQRVGTDMRRNQSGPAGYAEKEWDSSHR